MMKSKLITVSLLFLSNIAQFDAWAPVPTKVNGSSTTLFAKELSPSRRRFVQPRTQQHAYRSDSKIGSIHRERLKTAGRKGTRRFVDPCKVFVGNIPFDINKKELAKFILDTMGQSRMVLHSCKVIKDWKTGDSKGYGFLEFTDPVYATVCIDVCNKKEMNGRPIKVSQGRKKDKEDQVYIQGKRQSINNEEKTILNDSDQAEDGCQILNKEGVGVFDNSIDEDIELDAVLWGLDLDDDDEQDDGVFFERLPAYNEDFADNLNREQRRDVARRRTKKKMPSRGFG